MDATAVDIKALCEAYRRARAKILSMPEGFERNVGLAALRLEAFHGYQELVSTGVGLSQRKVAPLKEYVTQVKGGEGVESSIDAMDRQVQGFVKTVLRDLWSLLTTGVFAGTLAVIGDVVLVVAIAGEMVGAWLFGMLIAGGGAAYYLLRGGAMAGQGMSLAWKTTWEWASSVGTAADNALAEPRALQAQILQRAAAGGLAMTRFTDRVRMRAQLVMGFAWAAVGIALILMAVGFYEAATDWWASNPANPTSSLRRR
jgi:hypothetical protein